MSSARRSRRASSAWPCRPWRAAVRARARARCRSCGRGACRRTCWASALTGCGCRAAMLAWAASSGFRRRWWASRLRVRVCGWVWVLFQICGSLKLGPRRAALARPGSAGPLAGRGCSRGCEGVAWLRGATCWVPVPDTQVDARAAAPTRSRRWADCARKAGESERQRGARARCLSRWGLIMVMDSPAGRAASTRIGDLGGRRHQRFCEAGPARPRAAVSSGET